jgi:leucyl/phenylalanyl-tRNA---protein transferase
MPIFRLNRLTSFPPVNLAEPEGLLAVGGDLSMRRLLAAYRRGIFPWFGEEEPILWWSPDPRFVLFPKEAHVSHGMARLLRRDVYRITFDRDFSGVIHGCREAPGRRGGTWITPSMIEAYEQLHEAGYAHSVEAWSGGELAGGLYGVSLGALFFAESMFFFRPNASKAVLLTLCRTAPRAGIELIDCQVRTGHVASLGGRDISRPAFLALLQKALRRPTRIGSWSTLEGAAHEKSGPATDRTG